MRKAVKALCELQSVMVTVRLIGLQVLSHEDLSFRRDRKVRKTRVTAEPDSWKRRL